MTVKFQEKRIFPRIRFSAPLRYATRGVSGFDNAVCDDISAGGLSFINDKFIPPDTTLMLEINVLSKYLNPIVRIIRSASLAHTDKYLQGVEFLELEPEKRRYLTDYINMRIGKF